MLFIKAYAQPKGGNGGSGKSKSGDDSARYTEWAVNSAKSQANVRARNPRATVNRNVRNASTTPSNRRRVIGGINR